MNLKNDNIMKKYHEEVSIDINECYENGNLIGFKLNFKDPKNLVTMKPYYEGRIFSTYGEALMAKSIIYLLLEKYNGNQAFEYEEYMLSLKGSLRIVYADQTWSNAKFH